MIRIDDRDRVRTITFDRPERLNAFNDALYHASADGLRDAADRHDIACVVLTGAGRAFSAGQDLAEMATIDPNSGTDAAEHGFPVFFEAVSTFPKPLVAAVNGLGVGIGLTMLLYCDLVVMAESARLRAPFTALGVVPEAASSHMLPVVAGHQAAAWALYTSAWISAAEAKEWGLAWQVVPDGDALAAALTLAGEIAAMPTASLVETKRLVMASRTDAVRDANAREQRMFQAMLGRPANVEALTAFLEKRDPDFRSLPPQ
jgi:enoyl-CoA hydratase/carnithine racemase